MTQRSSDPRVCIVGAGSSGITAAKTLLERGVAVDCFERGSGIGGNWRFRNDNGMSSSYRSLHINTSKTRMAYSDFPMPEDYPDYPHHAQILDYFEDYVDHFGVREHITFGTTVTDVAPAGDGRWQVAVEGESARTYDAVVVANGHHWCPREPDMAGSWAGRSLHSHDYETPEPFAGERVLVVGIGNSGVDIACELSRIAERVVLSTRRSAHILPKYAFGKPIDQLASPLSSRLPLAVQKLAYDVVLGLSQGAQDGFGVPEPEHGLMQAHPTISADLLNLVGHGKLSIKPDIDGLEGDRVRFVDGADEPFDTIIYAIGYRIRFPFLQTEVLDPEGNEVRLYRNVVHPDRPGLFFVGLIQPLGAIMPLAEVQARWITGLVTGRLVLPERHEMIQRIDQDREAVRRRYVTSTRHTIQVDFHPYRRALEREMAAGRKRARNRHPTASSA